MKNHIFKRTIYKQLLAWKKRNSEIEFLRLTNSGVTPVEVKSGQRTQAKSLRQYIANYCPKTAIKISGKPLNKIDNSIIHNYPLYMAGMV